jgi:hypothetical protein
MNKTTGPDVWSSREHNTDAFNKKVSEYQNKLDQFRQKYKLIERAETAPSELSEKPSRSNVTGISTVSRLPELAPF